MFSKLLALCAFVAVSSAGLIPTAVHYSPASAVLSQSIVRSDKKVLAAPALAYHAAPAAVAYHAAPAPVAYHAAPAVVTYHAAPAAVTYHAAPAAVAYHAAPAAVAYHAPAPIAYHAAPVAKVIAAEEIAHPKYEFSYSVADGVTGDNKEQHEARDGDAVQGSYSFHEADGSIRTVQYSADDHSGFNAVVSNTAPTAAPAYIKAAPVVLKSPVYAAAPVAHYIH